MNVQGTGKVLTYRINFISGFTYEMLNTYIDNYYFSTYLILVLNNIKIQ